MAWIGEDAMIFRLSQKLNAKIKAGTLPALPLDENPFADWSAGLFLVGRTQYILLSNTKSLYSTVLPGKGVTDETSIKANAGSPLFQASFSLSEKVMRGSAQPCRIRTTEGDR